MAELLEVTGGISGGAILLLLVIAAVEYYNMWLPNNEDFFKEELEVRHNKAYIEQLTLSFMRGEDLGVAEEITPRKARTAIEENERLRSQIQTMRKVVDYRYEQKINKLESRYNKLKGLFKESNQREAELAVSMVETTGLTMRKPQLGLASATDYINSEGIDMNDAVNAQLEANRIWREERIRTDLGIEYPSYHDYLNS